MNNVFLKKYKVDEQFKPHFCGSYLNKHRFNQNSSYFLQNLYPIRSALSNSATKGILHIYNSNISSQPTEGIMNITNFFFLFFNPFQLMTLNMATTVPRPHLQNTMPPNWGQYNTHNNSTNSNSKTTFKGKIKAT